MSTFKLDGREIPFEKGDTIIRAAHRAGVDVPHYCWHPGLSVAANCRMCLVEVAPPAGRPALMLDVLRWDAAKNEYVAEKKPKLVPACQQGVADGMDVLSQTSEHVKRARAAVQELLLLNHPVDCPICDQAGECRLQDYWLEHQGTKKRMHDEPVHKPKGQVFGPTIVYDAERCIVCTRCVRVSEELAGDPVLSVAERGNLNEIVVSPGRQLDHNYTLMTEHVCPVGALTSSDFRFKARVWFLRSVRSVCVGCSKGCNSYTDFDPRSLQVHRYRPRDNANVNKYWMCDVGMLDYRRIHEGRILEARTSGESTTRESALTRAAALLAGAGGKLALVLSAEHSNEDNAALFTLGTKYLGALAVFYTGRPQGKADGILLEADRNPNTTGVLSICPTAKPIAELGQAVAAGQVAFALALGSAVPEDATASALSGLQGLVVAATHEGTLPQAAHVVLAASSWAEAAGTFINSAGIEQVSERAIPPLGESSPAWKLFAQLGQKLGHPTSWKRPEQIQANAGSAASEVSA